MLALGDCLPDTEEWPELVTERELVREPEPLPDTVWVPVVELDADCDGLIDGLEVTEKDPLELKVTVVEAVEQIVGDCVTEAEED